MQGRPLKSPLAMFAVVAAVVVVIGAVYACATRAAPGGGGNATAARTATTPTVQPQTQAIPINSVRRGDDPHTLLIEYAVGVGDCLQSLDRAEFKETSTTVTLSLVPKPSSKPTPAYCLDQVLLLTTTVRLADPLGERTVIDGRTGAILRVE